MSLAGGRLLSLQPEQLVCVTQVPATGSTVLEATQHPRPQVSPPRTASQCLGASCSPPVYVPALDRPPLAERHLARNHTTSILGHELKGCLIFDVAGAPKGGVRDGVTAREQGLAPVLTRT